MTFSTCFGGPFMVHHPLAYAELLKAEDPEARRARVAGEHRLDRRTVRRRQAHQHPSHARAAECRAQRLAAEGRVSARIRSSASRCRCNARACRRRSSIRRTPGPAASEYFEQVRRTGGPLHRELQADDGRVSGAHPGGRAEASHDRIGSLRDHPMRCGSTAAHFRGWRTQRADYKGSDFPALPTRYMGVQALSHPVLAGHERRV